jgi:hypothetical protein
VPGAAGIRAERRTAITEAVEANDEPLSAPTTLKRDDHDHRALRDGVAPRSWPGWPARATRSLRRRSACNDAKLVGYRAFELLSVDDPLAAILAQAISPRELSGGSRDDRRRGGSWVTGGPGADGTQLRRW